MEWSPLKVSVPQKRPRLSNDFAKCIVCQSAKAEPLRKAFEGGKTSFLHALKVRHRVGEDYGIYERISHLLEEITDDGVWKFLDDTDLYWHKNCFSSFTSSSNLTSITSRLQATEEPSTSQARRSIRKQVDFKNVCLFCDKKSYNKDRNLVKVATVDFCNTLEKKVDELGDYSLECKVGDFSKLIAYDACYHKGCHSKYLKQRAKTKDVKTSAHDQAFGDLLVKLLPKLKEGRAIDMNTIFVWYKEFLAKYVTEEEVITYRKQKLKEKLESHCGEDITIYSVPGNKPDLIVSKSLQLKDAINTAAQLKETVNEFQCQEENLATGNEDMPSPMKILYYAALILRSAIKDQKGIEHLPLNPRVIFLENWENVVPEELYSFLHWVLCCQDDFSPKVVTKVPDGEQFHRQILAVAQDLVYLKFRGKIKTPKHVGLSMTLHQMTQSKEVVALVNKLGYGISYDEVQRIDTCWTNMQLESDRPTIPLNMVPGRVLRGAGDNFNRATESLEGVHHDVVNMVLYQADSEGSGNIIDAVGGHFGQFHTTSKEPSRTITKAQVKSFAQLLDCPNMGGKNVGPHHLVGKAKLEWFFNCTSDHKNMSAIDQALITLRMLPMKIFNLQIEQKEAVPGWSAYHATLSIGQGSVCKTNIGYCPMLPASAVDYNTIYSMMKQFQTMFRSLGQTWTMITYDEAIYSKAQVIKWRNPDEFANDFLEMGGMHRVMNFMGDIGKVMADSGFEDIVVESDLYGSAAVSHIMKGNVYNKGVRMHKIMNEAMHRLKWLAFEKWIIETESAPSGEMLTAISKQADRCIELFNVTHSLDNGSFCDEIDTFMKVLRPLLEKLLNFTNYGRSCSETFVFWDNYASDYSQLLLDFISAKRNDDHKLELETFAEMMPLDFMCGHINYARWGTVNLVEGNLLAEEQPAIYQALSEGNWSVHHTTKPFSGVWHDMAIEQSINRDCGKYRHLCTREEALQKYYHTAHLKGACASTMKTVCGIKTASLESHKEAGSARVNKDAKAVDRVVQTVSARMINPFEVDQGSSTENKQPLVNIATCAVAPLAVANCLNTLRLQGSQKLKDFIEKRINSVEEDFFAPIARPKLHTFSESNKSITTKRNQKICTTNSDRQIFSKLAIIGQARDIDLKELMSYELSPVPLALFNLDGTFRKTAKSATLSWLEQEHSMTDTPDNSASILVVDLMMLIHMICTEKTDCATFGDLSEALLRLVVSPRYRYIAVVADCYETMSIKGQERDRRGHVQMQEIRNPSRNTPLPKQKAKMLSNPRNKVNLTKFLMQDWVELSKLKLSDQQTLFLAGGCDDPRKVISVDATSVHDVEELFSDHQEADSRMFVHISHAVRHLEVKQVILWSCDSDVAALCPRYIHLLGIDELFFRTGTGRKRRYIPMHLVATDLGYDLSLVLPSMHAVSGCDSTSAFCGVGKKKWLNVLRDNPDLVRHLEEFGKDPKIVSDNVMTALVNLTSLVYSNKRSDSLNAVRYELFSQKTKASERLPPTMDAFEQHIKRSNYQSYIWLHATQASLNMPAASGRGWKINSAGELIPVLMKLPPAPDAVLALSECHCKTNCATNRCGCRKEKLVCSDVCGCDTECCSNRLVGYVSDSSDDEM